MKNGRHPNEYIKDFLWWDHHETQPLEERLQRAINAHVVSRGSMPDWVWVNPRDAGEEYPTEIGDTQVLITTATLPLHFMLGVEGAA